MHERHTLSCHGHSPELQVPRLHSKCILQFSGGPFKPVTLECRSLPRSHFLVPLFFLRLSFSMGEGKTGSPDHWRAAPSSFSKGPVCTMWFSMSYFQAGRLRTDLAFWSIWICTSLEPQEAGQDGGQLKRILSKRTDGDHVVPWGYKKMGIESGSRGL